MIAWPDVLTTIAKVLGVWLAAAVVIAWGFSRWMRFLRGDFDGETPWEASGIFDEVEVRWKDGRVESRTKH